MNTTFERSSNSTDEWYTPKEIIDALGEFDLDPCAPVAPLYKTASVMYNKNDDGLKQEWKGRVWLNPPYSRPLIECFVKRMAEHGNGIALLFNRCDSKMFQDVIFEKATAMKFLRNRIRFFRPDGTRGDSPGCGSILIAAFDYFLMVFHRFHNPYTTYFHCFYLCIDGILAFRYNHISAYLGKVCYTKIGWQLLKIKSIISNLNFHIHNHFILRKRICCISVLIFRNRI